MEELAERLSARDLDVTVYCRSHNTPRSLKSYRGARLVVLPTLRGKHLDTPIHTMLSTLDAAFRGFDAALVVNSANAIFLPILRLAGIPVALHVDGIEKRRAKWGRFGRAVYSVSERLACRLPNLLISDAGVIHDHYLRRFGAASEMITYGVTPDVPATTPTLERLGLEPRGYLLYVSRFEPENNPHRVVEAYASVPGEMPLLMVGGAPYSDDFIASMKERADRRVLFPGPIYGAGYRELLGHAYAYIHATEVGGTHPALVEAMGYGNCTVVNDTPENREVAGPNALYFSVNDPATLAAVLSHLLATPGEAARGRLTAKARASERFDWDIVVDQYAALFRRLAKL
jgi:glycosyltransferase involved in cell wall biosynthesis